MKGVVNINKCEIIEPNFDVVEITVLLNKITDIADFVSLASKCKDDVTIGSGRFAINAKSIMGLYSLDLTKPLKVKFFGNIPYEVEDGMKKFILD